MVVSLKKKANGEIRFREECDRYFCASMSKKDAIKALEEAIEWIKEKRDIEKEADKVSDEIIRIRSEIKTKYSLL